MVYQSISAVLIKFINSVLKFIVSMLLGKHGWTSKESHNFDATSSEDEDESKLILRCVDVLYTSYRV